MKQYKAGLFGLGVVGSGVFQALRESLIPISIEKIVVNNPQKKRGFKVDPKLMQYQKENLINDPELDIIIELINDPHEAFEIVSAALKSGKAVVTANKKMVSIYHRELLKLQKENNVQLLYEGAVCGSIPILRLLDQQFAGDEIESIRTIANGTCNYILTQMIDRSWSYSKALQEAQNLGFAESDPYSDVSGEDTRFKLSIMILHVFGAHINAENIPMLGIEQIDDKAIALANQFGLNVKLVGEAKWKNGQLEASVIPHFIGPGDDLFQVSEEYNAVAVHAKFASQQFFKGKGAGSFPTSSAVISNLNDIIRGTAYNFPKEPVNLNSTNAESGIFYLSDGERGEMDFEFDEVFFHENGQWIVRGLIGDILSIKEKDSLLNAIKMSAEVLDIILNSKVLV